MTTVLEKKDQFISFKDDFERNIKDVANFLYSNMSNIREKFSFPQCDSDLKNLFYPDLLDRIVRENTMKI